MDFLKVNSVLWFEKLICDVLLRWMLEKWELIFSVNFKFFWYYFPIDGNILKKTYCGIVL